jgi:hypothetical protein
VAEHELVTAGELRGGLVPLGSARDPGRELTRGLELALTRGTLLAVRPIADDDPRRWYTLNTASGRQLVGALEAGQQSLAAVASSVEALPVVEERPNIFRLYERHIAVLTPLVAQQLAEAATDYPAGWIVDAFSEAVARDRRSWRFIRHLLDRWSSEGREHATHRRHTARPLDPNKYTKGKYADLFRH